MLTVIALLVSLAYYLAGQIFTSYLWIGYIIIIIIIIERYTCSNYFWTTFQINLLFTLCQLVVRLNDAQCSIANHIHASKHYYHCVTFSPLLLTIYFCFVQCLFCGIFVDMRFHLLSIHLFFTLFTIIFCQFWVFFFVLYFFFSFRPVDFTFYFG